MYYGVQKSSYDLKTGGIRWTRHVQPMMEKRKVTPSAAGGKEVRY